MYRRRHQVSLTHNIVNGLLDSVVATEVKAGNPAQGRPGDLMARLASLGDTASGPSSAATSDRSSVSNVMTAPIDQPAAAPQPGAASSTASASRAKNAAARLKRAGAPRAVAVIARLVRLGARARENSDHLSSESVKIEMHLHRH